MFTDFSLSFIFFPLNYCLLPFACWERAMPSNKCINGRKASEKIKVFKLIIELVEFGM